MNVPRWIVDTFILYHFFFTFNEITIYNIIIFKLILLIIK